MVLELGGSISRTLKSAIGHKPHLILTLYLHKVHFNIIPTIYFSAFQMDVFQEASPLKFCLHFLPPLSELNFQNIIASLIFVNILNQKLQPIDELGVGRRGNALLPEILCAIIHLQKLGEVGTV